MAQVPVPGAALQPAHAIYGFNVNTDPDGTNARRFTTAGRIVAMDTAPHDWSGGRRLKLVLESPTTGHYLEGLAFETKNQLFGGGAPFGQTLFANLHLGQCYVFKDVLIKKRTYKVPNPLPADQLPYNIWFTVLTTAQLLPNVAALEAWERQNT